MSRRKLLTDGELAGSTEIAQLTPVADPDKNEHALAVPPAYYPLFLTYLPDGTRIRYKVFYSGRGAGKAISVSEFIPTPDGWKELGDIQVGDKVFDEAGKPCRVIEVHESTPKESYRVFFSDGAVLDCCADHEWVTWTHVERKSFLRSPYDDATRFPADWPNWRRYTNQGR